MKKILILLCFLSFLIDGVSQISFSKLVETGYPQSKFYQMTVDNADNIVGYGIAFSDTIDWKQGLVFAKIDSAGSLLKSTFLLDSLDEKLAVQKHWGGIIQTVDGGYAATAAVVGREAAFLIKLDKDLEVEFIKEYLDTINISNFDYSLAEVPTGYILYGEYQTPNLRRLGFVRHVDKQGNFIWQRDFGQTAQITRILDLQVWQDSILILVYPIIYDTNPLVSDQFIEYLDLSGNTIKSLTWDFSEEIGTAWRIIPKDDGGLILNSAYITEWVGSTQILHNTISRFDADLELVCYVILVNLKVLMLKTDYGHSNGLFDGNYVGAGEHTFKVGNAFSRRGGCFFHFNPLGDSLWFKLVEPPLPPLLSNNGFFAGVGVLSDGSVVAGGGADEGNQTSVWVVKVNCSDSLFCGDPILGTAKEFSYPMEWVVYPNPARDIINIEFLGDFIVEDIRLFDAQGRLVYQSEASTQNQLLSIPVRDFSAGLYFVQIWAKEIGVQTKKVMIGE